MKHTDHPAIERRHDGLGAALDGAFQDGEQVLRAVRHVDVGILLEQNQRRGIAHRALADIAVQVELDTHRDVGADHLAHVGEQVAFAIVVALGDHRAVAGQEHGIDRHRCLEIGDDLVAETLIDLFHRLAGRHGEGAQALDDLPAFGLGALAPDGERRTEHRHILAVAGLAEQAGVLEELMTSGNGGECVGLGAQARGEDLFHPSTVAASVLGGDYIGNQPRHDIHVVSRRESRTHAHDHQVLRRHDDGVLPA